MVYQDKSLENSRHDDQRSETHRRGDHRQDIEHVVSHTLEEARMILPGIQALLGFQLVAVFNQPFGDISKFDQYLHVAAIFFSVNAICFLLTSAALHRQSEPLSLTKDFAKAASRLTFAGMIPLMLSMVLDSYVVIQAVSDNHWISCSIAGVLFAELAYFWILYPISKRKKRPGEDVIGNC